MIRAYKNVYILGTEEITYMFQVLPSGHLEHLYFGASLGNLSDISGEEMLETAEALCEKRAFAAGNMISYSKDHPTITLEDLRLEMSSYGKGDIREPLIEVTHADGSTTSDFLFDYAEISKGKQELGTLPTSYAENREEVDHLKVVLTDQQYHLSLELHYDVFEDCHVITRTSILKNNSEETVKLNRLMSTQIDFEKSGFVFSNFTGAWAREMERHDTALHAGKIVNASFTGTSSNRANSFVMLHDQATTEDYGDCYGFNLIYSGNHYEAAEVNAFGKTRFVSGINPQNFEFAVHPGETFEAPEAVMTYSEHGFTGMSHQMHRFVREHIVRGYWKHKTRPVLLNSWEAAYFKINESRLVNLAKKGKEVGIELFVMDDGWFGERDDDTRSLGDWTVNKKKLPNGLKGLADKINHLGMDFGIWIEPEMVNVNSDLYRSHPEWTMEIPGHPHSEGRNQRLLDLANPEVVDYMAKQIMELLSSANISYVKWDMNRIMSDIYSQYIKSECQKETSHRYVMGLYQMMKRITEAFPEILFEGCAAGGNRFDLGILCFMPQIWASDDTDALQRVNIQEGYSYGYPMSVVSAHVSGCPNHQTLREAPLDTRFNVAAYGMLGYELNLADLNRTQLAEIKDQISLYKEWREVLQFGKFYRGRSGNIHEWTCLSEDKSKAVGMIFQEKVIPNVQFEQFYARGLDDHCRYEFYNISRKHDLRKFGDLVNTAAPIHVRQDSMLHNMLAKLITMPGEQERVRATGALMKKAGIKLHQAYSATGYDDKTRYFPDYGSRMYFIEKIK